MWNYYKQNYEDCVIELCNTDRQLTATPYAIMNCNNNLKLTEVFLQICRKIKPSGGYTGLSTYLATRTREKVCAWITRYIDNLFGMLTLVKFFKVIEIKRCYCIQIVTTIILIDPETT